MLACRACGNSQELEFGWRCLPCVHQHFRIHGDDMTRTEVSVCHIQRTQHVLRESPNETVDPTLLIRSDVV